MLRVLKAYGIISILLLASVGAALYFGVFPSSEQTEDKAAEAPQDPVVQVETLRLAKLSDRLTLPGVVKADGVLAVTSFGEGIVGSCRVGLGDPVRKGDALCVIENDNPSATYLPFTVGAPVSGTVGEIHTPVGSRVSKGQKVVTLLRSNKTRVAIEMPVPDAKKLEVGLEASWQIATSTGEDLRRLKVVGVSPLPDPVTRTVTVELEGVGEGPGLPGELGNVSFDFNVRDGLEVPLEAIKYRGTDPFLLKVASDTVTWVAVKVGRLKDGQSEILSGVAAGDVIVTSSPKFLGEGAKIQIQTGNLAGDQSRSAEDKAQ